MRRDSEMLKPRTVDMEFGLREGIFGYRVRYDHLLRRVTRAGTGCYAGRRARTVMNEELFRVSRQYRRGRSVLTDRLVASIVFLPREIGRLRDTVRNGGRSLSHDFNGMMDEIILQAFGWGDAERTGLLTAPAGLQRGQQCMRARAPLLVGPVRIRTRGSAAVPCATSTGR